jgi:hypothetical protein
MIDRSAVTTQWLVAAIFAKACGATDPAAVVSQAAREWEDSWRRHDRMSAGQLPPRRGDSSDPFDLVPAHIRRIQELAEEQAGT